MAAELNKIRIKNATDHEIYVSVQQEESSDFSFPSGSAAYYTVAPGQLEVWSRSQGNRPHYNYWVQDQGVTHKYRTSSTADKSYLGNGRIFDGLYGTSVPEEPPQQNACAAPIVPGEYYYIISRYTGKALTNPPGIMALQQAAKKSDGLGQLFRFTAAGGGYYFITAKHNEQEIFAVSLSDYAEVYMVDKDRPGAEVGNRVQWYFEDAGGGYYYLKCRDGHKPMEIYGAHKEDATKMVIYKKTGADHQLWRFVNVKDAANAPITPGNDYYIISKHSEKAMSVDGASKSSNAAIIQWSPVGVDHQKFHLIPQADGYYYIMSKNSGQVIAAQGTESETGIVQYPTQGLDETTLNRFRWMLEPVGFDFFRIVSKASGRSIHIYYARLDDGMKMVLWDKADEDQNLWRFVSAGTTSSTPAATGALQWHAFEGLGGGVTPENIIGAVTRGVNRMYYFVRGMDNAIWCRPMENGAWGDWANLGGGLIGNPSAVSWGGNRIDMFARGADNAIWHQATDGGAWSGWESRGYPTGVTFTSDPTAVSWGPNRLDIFGRGSDGAVWHQAWNNGWSAWESLGGGILGNISAVCWGPNRIDYVVRGTDNSFWHRPMENGAWGAWAGLGGGFTSDPTVVSWGSGRLDIFGRGGDGAVWHMSGGNGWSAWESLGGTIDSSVNAVCWGPNRIDLFIQGSDGALWHQAWNGSAWCGWESLGGTVSSRPTAVTWGQNYLHVLVVGSGTLSHRWTL